MLHKRHDVFPWQHSPLNTKEEATIYDVPVTACCDCGYTSSRPTYVLPQASDRSGRGCHFGSDHGVAWMQRRQQAQQQCPTGHDCQKELHHFPRHYRQQWKNHQQNLPCLINRYNISTHRNQGSDVFLGSVDVQVGGGLSGLKSVVADQKQNTRL